MYLLFIILLLSFIFKGDVKLLYKYDSWLPNKK